MQNFQIRVLIFVGFALATGNSATTETTSSDIIDFPYQANPCKCSFFSCTCCQGVVASSMQLQKTICLKFSLNIIYERGDLEVSVDNKTIAAFALDPKNPPKYCVPIPDETGVAMCLQLSDIELVGFTALQVCPVFYTNYQSSQVISFKFPCIKLSTSGVDLMKK